MKKKKVVFKSFKELDEYVKQNREDTPVVKSKKRSKSLYKDKRKDMINA